MDKRSAKEVIDQAISENRACEILLYILATAAACTGLFVMVWSAFIQQPLSALAGGLCTGLFWPAMHLAKQTRKENIMLRMLETPLSRASTAIAAAETLQKAFIDIFGEQHPVAENPKPPSLPFIQQREEL